MLYVLIFGVSSRQTGFASKGEEQAGLVDKGGSGVPDVDLVVRTINTHYNAPGYPLRLLGIARKFRQAWPHTVGVIGMQEVRGVMDNCPDGTGGSNGAGCFASILSRIFNVEVDSAYSVPNHVGIVAGRPWRITGSDHWNVGSLFEKRYLLETRLIHTQKRWRLKFYTVHLSSQKKHVLERLKQVRNVIRIVRGRATPGELPPVVVGDFNAGRTYGVDPEPSVLEMEKYFWRPIDEAVGRGTHGTGIDIVYIGRKSAFRKSKGEYVVVRSDNVSFSGIPVRVDGFPGVFDELTDHDSQGFGLRIKGVE